MRKSITYRILITFMVLLVLFLTNTTISGVTNVQVRLSSTLFSDYFVKIEQEQVKMAKEIGTFLLLTERHIQSTVDDPKEVSEQLQTNIKKVRKSLEVIKDKSYGLSYTTFAYADLKVSRKGVTFNITNTGNHAGSEIAQLYVGCKSEAIFRPKKELKGFKKVYLQPGETKEVTISFDDKTFRYFNVKTNQWEIEDAEYEIMIGASSVDIRLNGNLHVEGTAAPVPYEKENCHLIILEK